MKQGPQLPLPVVKQVVFIYAGVNGYLDDIEPAHVGRFESQLYEYLDARKPEIVGVLEQKRDMTPEIKQGLNQLLDEFKKTFQP